MLPGRLGEIAIRHEVHGRMPRFGFDAAGVGLFRFAGGLPRERNSQSRKQNRAHEKTKANLGSKH